MSVGSITKNASALFVGKIVSSVFGFFFNALIARIMMPSEFGVIALTLSTIFLVLPFVDVGIDESLIYFIPRLTKKKGELKDLLKKSLLIKFCLGFVIFLLFYFTAGMISSLYNEPLLENALRVLSITSLCYPLFLTFQFIFVGFQRMFYVMYSNISFSIIKFLPIILFLFSGFWGAVYGYSMLYVLSFVVAGLFFLKIYSFGPEPGKFPAGKLLRFSGGMFIATLLSQFSGNALLILLGFFSSAEQVAYMEISFTIGILLSFSALALADSLRPTLTEIDSKKTKEIISRITKYMILSTIPLSTLAIVLRSSLIRFIYTSTYMAATSTMAWVSVGFCFLGCFASFQAVAFAMGKRKELIIRYLIEAVMVLAFGLLLIPAEGSVGAAKTFAFSVILSMSYLAVRFRKVGYPINDLFKAVLASGIMVLPILFIWNWTFGIYKLLLCGALGVGTYLLVIFLLRGLDREDITLLKKLFTRVRSKL